MTKENHEPRPAPSSDADWPTSSQLAAAIQRCETGDKVPFGDPAAAPLGTDDEAAGTSPTGAQVAASLAAETGRPNDVYANASATAFTNVEPGPAPTSRGDLPASAPWIAVLVLLATVLGAWFGMRAAGLL